VSRVNTFPSLDEILTAIVGAAAVPATAIELLAAATLLT